MRSAVFSCIVTAYLLMCGAIARAAGPGYVIITTTNIVQQSTELTNFVAHKQDLGFEVQVVSNTDAGWNGGTADTAADNIRAWLQENYTNASAEIVIDYALLIGDPNPTNGNVPMKLCYPRATNEACPTDFYYADLTGNWDINGNEHYGEYADYTNACGADRHYEVAVGRIPFYGNVGDLDGIFQKIINYEDSALTNADWRANALLALANQNLFTYGSTLGAKVTTGILEPAAWDYTALYHPNCTEANVLCQWTNTNRGVFLLWGHGNTNAPVGTQVGGWNLPGLLFSINSVESLDDSHPTAAFLCGCLMGHPETTNNLARTLLGNGCVSVVAATRETYYYPMWQGIGVPVPESIWFGCGVNPRLLYDHTHRLVREWMPTGNALYDLKHDGVPITEGITDPSAPWSNYLSYNLYGCPATAMFAVFTGPVWSF